jgi:hypothetical protein
MSGISVITSGLPLGSEVPKTITERQGLTQGGSRASLPLVGDMLAQVAQRYHPWRAGLSNKNKYFWEEYSKKKLINVSMSTTNRKTG